MLVLRIILASFAFVFMIVTLIIYLNMKKTLKKNTKIDKSYIEKQTKTFTILMIISILLGIAAVVFGIIYKGSKIKENLNISPSNYEMYIKQYRDADDIKSKLELFKDTIEEENVLEFSEFNRDGLFNKSYFLCLKYQYDKKTIKEEIERINSLSRESIEDNKIPYLIYIVTDSDSVKEYALIDEEKYQIIYIFNQSFNKDEIKIDVSYFID